MPRIDLFIDELIINVKVAERTLYIQETLDNIIK